MRSFHHCCKFCTLTINFSKVWPRQILLWITIFAERLRNVLNTSRTLVYKNSLTWSYALKTSWKRLEDIFERRLEDVLKMSWRCFEEILRRLAKTSWRRLEDLWSRRRPRRLNQDELKTSWKLLLKTKTKDIFKTCLEDKCLLG